MEDALWYDTIAQLYRFTPAVADEIPYELLQRMVEVAAIRNEVSERKAKG